MSVSFAYFAAVAGVAALKFLFTMFLASFSGGTCLVERVSTVKHFCFVGCRQFGRYDIFIADESRMKPIYSYDTASARNKETAFGRFFIAWRKRAGRLRALRVRFEGLGLPAQPAPNPPPAAAARQLRAPQARVRGSN
ncbi:hypothetical protein O0882_23540 [Janthinobacterium sp. SUN073]|uniref:hypothetical protein n=1 Tax=Janthinobacterium sp. SUN073 TaxID=3004102 RepID=UPI0025AFCC1F|nr:hypothetical protein [Janthinobacterium sp. SUN073]MDN2699294.1 hypothetical protein [Janthinobacterium sp. SUN073]